MSTLALLGIAALYYAAKPWLDTEKRRLSTAGFSAMTIVGTVNLFGHPPLMAYLFATDQFVLPANSAFWAYWTGVVVLAALHLSLFIYGLVRSNFFAASSLLQLGFVVSSGLGLVVLGESFTSWQMMSLVLAVLGVLAIGWPLRQAGNWMWDRGLLVILLSLFIAGAGALCYKAASLEADSYAVFLSGRLVGDLLLWGSLWLGWLLLGLRRNPLAELARFARLRAGIPFIIATTLSSLLVSWLIFSLPLSYYAMLSPLSLVASYCWSVYHYRETPHPRQLAGALLVVLAVLLFASRAS